MMGEEGRTEVRRAAGEGPVSALGGAGEMLVKALSLRL